MCKLASVLLSVALLLHTPARAQDIGPALTRGVRQQVQGILAGGKSLKPDDPVAAAQLGEEMKLQAVLLQGFWQSAAKNSQLPAFQQQTAQLFKTSYGLDLAALKLTAQGFAKR